MRVLIADTDKGTRSQACEILREGKCECLEAESFEEAIVLATLPGQTVDVLLTDILLPPYHGGTLANRIHPFHSRLKVLFMSGQPADALLACGLLVPGAAFIRKPFSKVQLLNAVSTARRKIPDWSKVVIEFTSP